MHMLLINKFVDRMRISAVHNVAKMSQISHKAMYSDRLKAWYANLCKIVC